MGVDLTLMPMNGTTAEGKARFPHAKIPLDRDRSLWVRIEQSKIERPWGSLLSGHHDEEGYTETAETPYGTPLTVVHAGQIRSILSDYLDDLAANKSTGWEPRWTLAACSYLRQLPADTEVVLWWW